MSDKNLALVEDMAAILSNAKQRNRRLCDLRACLEEEMADRPYQMMAVYQRDRHRRVEGENWPDKSTSEPALSRYPNILAELDASGWWLDRVAMYANVSMEIMAAAMEDNGELSLGEMGSLKRGFECELDYLTAPVLSMVDPATNKGRVRIQRLKDLLRQTEGMDIFLYRNYSSGVLPKLEGGKPVTFAAYRWACKNLQDVLDSKAREAARQRRIRTGDLSPTQTREEAHTELRTRIQQARERDRVRKLKKRLAEIHEYVESTKMKECYGCSEDLVALADLSRRDLYGSLILAFLYGRAMGYQETREATARCAAAV